jgi:hypothetical protein
MASKPTPKPALKAAPAFKSSPASASSQKTVSRNTPVPRPQVAKTVTNEMVAKRAYEIYISGKGGSQIDNWLRAEKELKSGI